MQRTARLVIALAFGGAVAVAASVAPAAHHDVKRHHIRHLQAHHAPPGQPWTLSPAKHPEYRYGGPLYSTCDRINADPMLVGTCR